MPPTKAELEAENAELKAQLESGNGEAEIPEHGHSKRETALQRQKRLAKQHEKGETTGANTQQGRQNRLRVKHATAALDELSANTE